MIASANGRSDLARTVTDVLMTEMPTIKDMGTVLLLAKLKISPQCDRNCVPMPIWNMIGTVLLWVTARS